jgi:LPS export ABC transporter permease LptG
MRLYDRYLWGRMVGPFLVGLGGFVVLIVGHGLYQMSQTIVERRLPVGPVLELVCLSVPPAAVMAVPVSTLLAAALAFNGLARDNELAPLRAAGLSMFRLQRPALLFGLMTTVGTFCLAEFVAPWTKRATVRVGTQIIRGRRTVALRPGQFVDVGGGNHFYAQEVDDRAQTIDGLIAVTVPAGEYPFLIQARKATLRGEECEFFGAVIYHVLDERFVTRGVADHGNINLPELIASLAQRLGEHEQQSIAELLDRLRRLDAGTDARARRYAMELHSRIALPCACAIFAFMAGPVTLRFARAEALVGVLVTILVIFVYFLVMLWMKTLGSNGQLPPVVAAWSPNLLFAGLGLLFTRRQR